MKTFGNIKPAANKMIFVFALVLFSGVKSFGQQTPAVAVASDNQSGAQMELVSWMMATRQSQSANDANLNPTSTAITGKKQFINNGLSTSRILNRAFLKKIVSREVNVA